MLKTFKGGVHSPGRKKFTSSLAVENVPLPEKVVLPLVQHIGAPNEPVVQKGDFVKAGQKIAESSAFVSAPVHSPVAGEVISIEPYPSFTGVSVMSIIIKTAEEQVEEKITILKESELIPEKIRGIVKEAGLVGLGGAAFPTHVKHSPPPEKKITDVIINGCECESFLTVDHRNMLEEGEAVIDGLKLILKTLSVENGFIAIEDNKQDAVENIKSLIGNNESIKVVALSTRYPQGAEKQLIKTILDKEVPSGGLPFDVGALVQNVGTTIALSKAIREGKPLIERTVTVTGTGISTPKNLRV
ncbi:MAG: RnfABCDGE type electron transport complex subunit C, partial [Actinomycetia bacterium]|nr:RnfABCDGE type electron transport complex subunit C [Actinomycetes bacterium]